MANKPTRRAADHTSYEVRRRWDMANLKKYSVSLHIEKDAELIQFIEENKGRYKTSELFRRGIEKLKNEGL